MNLFRRLALDRFVKTHPPSRQVSPASAELAAAFAGTLPASLLELWRRKGFGFYGEQQFALIDPRLWQPVLDRWIVSAPDAVRRIPIAVTSLGKLLYYRRLTETDEDVSSLDPLSNEIEVLSWSLDEFFNQTLCEQASLEPILSPGLVTSAREDHGPLAAGEVYEMDKVLLSMHMLKTTKVDALAMHRRFRDAVDAPKRRASKPATVAEALPADHLALFEGIEAGLGLIGLYLSSASGWHRMLALRPDGYYSLLFWHINDWTYEREEVRAYNGAYNVARSAEGDEHVSLELALRKDSSGGDPNDERLVAMQADGLTFLLRTIHLDDIATAVGGRDTMGDPDEYFLRVLLGDAFVDAPTRDRPAPSFAQMPRALQALVHVVPLLATITHVAAPGPDEEEDGDGTVMCTLDLGTEDGLRMNMPLYSPAGSGRNLEGWVWRMDPHACRVGIDYTRPKDGSSEHRPVVGDVLTTRNPDLDPAP